MSDHTKNNPRAMGMLGADDPVKAGPTDAGTQPPPRKRGALLDVPVGIERVLYLAAVEPDFRRRLMADREAALADRGLRIRASEQALLMAVPDQMLARNIDGIDASPHNLERRTFLQAVAASAAAGAAVLSQGCGDDNDSSMGIRPDMGTDTVPVKEQGPTMDGVMPGDFAKPDTVPWKNDGQGLPDAGILPDMPKPDGE